MPHSGDRTYADFAVGDYVTFTRRFSAQDFERFAKVSGDRNPLHHDRAYAEASRFDAPIVPLHLTAAPLSAVAGMMIPGHRSLYLQNRVRALAPAAYDRDIVYSAKITARNDAKSTLTLRALAFSNLDLLLDAELLVQVRDDVTPDLAPAQGKAVPVQHDDQRNAVVTGATGEIGQAIAVALARAGWNLILLHRGRNDVAKALKQDCQAIGAKVSLMSGALDDPRALGRLCTALAKRAEVTDLVHTSSPGLNAGFDELMAVNHRALTRLGEALLPAMLTRQDGRVLLIGSSAVQHNPKGWGDYIAAKTAASQWVSALDNKYGDYGINGWVVAPGYVLTRFSAAFRPPDAPSLMPEQVAENVVGCLKDNERRPGRYVWLEPQVTRYGAFSFHETGASGRGTFQANVETRVATAPDTDVKASTAPSAADGIGWPEALIRAFLGATDSIDMSDAGIDQFAGWDSLRHIELMLHIEQELGIVFSAGEIERTTRFTDLCALIAEKTGGRA